MLQELLKTVVNNSDDYSIMTKPSKFSCTAANQTASPVTGVIDRSSIKGVGNILGIILIVHTSETSQV